MQKGSRGALTAKSLRLLIKANQQGGITPVLKNVGTTCTLPIDKKHNAIFV